MASGKIIKELDFNVGQSNPSSGSSSTTVLNMHWVKIGKAIQCSCRTTMNSAVTNGLSLLYGQLPYKCRTDAVMWPSVVCLHKSGSRMAYTDLVMIINSDNASYLQQRVTNTLAKDDEVDMFVTYLTN